MKLERSNVQFAVWRKKVDRSLFEHNGTTIPDWVCGMWNLHSLYSEVTSKRDPQASATVSFERENHPAWVTAAPHGRRKPAYRLWYSPILTLALKRRFVMSYMRSLEGALDGNSDVEETLPFWEFLDVEFDPAKRVFHFVAYYKQQPSFPNLFERLIGSPALNKLTDELFKKDRPRIYKRDWKPRSEFQFELGAKNVIYTLLDTAAKLLYIGEADDLIKRFSQGHDCIPNWDLYRYNVLPDALTAYRLALERMIIRDFAAILNNKKSVKWRDVSGCQLVNERVDR